VFIIVGVTVKMSRRPFNSTKLRFALIIRYGVKPYHGLWGPSRAENEFGKRAVLCVAGVYFKGTAPNPRTRHICRLNLALRPSIRIRESLLSARMKIHEEENIHQKGWASQRIIKPKPA